MKKVLLIITCLILCLSLISCGSKAMSMEDYAAQMQEELATDDMDDAIFSVVARGNSLVYSYQFTYDTGDRALLQEALDQALTEQAPAFKDLLPTLRESVPDAKSIIVEYRDMNGTIITSKEFK